MIKKESIFSIDPKAYKTWLSNPQKQCKTPGMLLWMAFENLRNNTDFMGNNVNLQLKPRKYNKFPSGKTTDCKCRFCRYQRIFHKCQVS